MCLCVLNLCMDGQMNFLRQTIFHPLNNILLLRNINGVNCVFEEDNEQILFY